MAVSMAKGVNADAVREGSVTPWGRADLVTHLAQGIVVVSTPSHGGIGLSPERNSQIDPTWRRDSGWYEEDCEANIPAAQFPEYFGRVPRGQVLDALRYWYPREFAAIYEDEDRARAGQETSEDWRRDLAARRAAQGR